MFDKKAYRDSVLQPLKANASKQAAIADALRALNDATDRASVTTALAKADAAALFALTPGMSNAELTKHFRDLEMFLNKTRIPVVVSIKQLVKTSKASLGDYISNPAFWDEVIKKTSQIRKEELKAFALAVKQDNPLGAVTAEELRKAASSYGISTSVSDKELAGAVKARGVEVYPKLKVSMADLGVSSSKLRLHPSFRSLVDVLLIHERGSHPSDIRVIDELSAVVDGRSRRRVTTADIKKSKTAANTRSDDATESAKKTLTVIAQKSPTDAALQSFILAWFADLADNLVARQGLTPTLALNRLTALGLDDQDARRLVVSVSTGGGGSKGPDLASAKEMIAAGDLAGARRLYTSFIGTAGEEKDPVALQVAEALAAAEKRKQSALDAYHKAVEAKDYARARQALADAQAVDHEDTEIVRLLSQIPPDAPTNLRLTYSSNRNGVLLSWRGSQDQDVSYVVVRSDSGAPANPKAGFQVVPSTTEQEAFDSDPLIAQQSVYAVFALRQEGAYSTPAVSTLTVLPPPTDINAAVTNTDATVFWQVAKQAAGVSAEVVEADGSRRKFPATSQGRMVIDNLKLGEKYTLVLKAHYIVNGQSNLSETATIDVTPRGTVQAVRDLCLANVTMPNGKAGVRAKWSEVPGYTTDLWAFPIDSTVKVGDLLSVDKLDKLTAKRVVGSIRNDGATQSMDFYELRDIRMLVPLTWDGSEAIAGNSLVTGKMPHPREVEAMRFGSELKVSWIWPHGDYMMDVTWSSLDGKKGQKRVDRLTYKHDGGVNIPNAQLITEVGVATVVIGLSETAALTPVTISLEAVPPSMSYQLKLPKGVFGGHEARASVTSEEFTGTVDLIAVLTPGAFMPAKATDGQEIAHLHLDFSSGLTQSCTFRVPKLKGPYWVRLFADPASKIILNDPPTSSMKG